MDKRGQVTIFIIIAMVIVAAAISVFVFRDSIFPSDAGSEFSEIYESFDDCVERGTLDALGIAGVQGGYVDVPEFEPGSNHAPFSNQLDFLGNPVPYWYYVSSNGVVKEQVPTLSVIESQVEEYLEEEIMNCDFTSFRKQGFVIDFSEPRVNVEIRDENVDVAVDLNLVIEKGDSKERKSKHDVRVDSEFGRMYSLARDVYSKQKKDALFESYGVDTLYNYVPVTGSEMSCSPLVWNPQEVVDDLKQGLSANVGALKLDGDYYELKSKEEKYFVIDVESDYSANFIYNVDWPTRVEVWPVENSVMIAEPVGLEQGMGILGFCYVPYHFVYDVYYPVLVQISNEEEIFQFPVSVVIDKSVAREALQGDVAEDTGLEGFCSNKNTRVEVNTYDSDLNGLEANINFICFNERCGMGKTSVSGGSGTLVTEFPQCVNGKVVASAEGYVSASEIVSTNEFESVDLILDKLYEIDLELLVDGRGVDLRDGGMAIVRFEGEFYNGVAAYPQQSTIKLAQGFYNVSVQIFSEGNLRIPGSSTRNCVDVPSGGIAGVFGRTKEECFTIELPAQTLSHALTAGGKSVEFISEEFDLRGRELVIDIPSLPRPASLEQLQQNYQLVESNYLEVSFR
jgi:hypothetical protein